MCRLFLYLLFVCSNDDCLRSCCVSLCACVLRVIRFLFMYEMVFMFALRRLRPLLLLVVVCLCSIWCLFTATASTLACCHSVLLCCCYHVLIDVYDWYLVYSEFMHSCLYHDVIVRYCSHMCVVVYDVWLLFDDWIRSGVHHRLLMIYVLSCVGCFVCVVFALRRLFPLLCLSLCVMCYRVMFDVYGLLLFYGDCLHACCHRRVLVLMCFHVLLCCMS